MQRRNITLKERLVEHYHKKDEMLQPGPKDATRLGMAFFWGMTVTVYLEMIFVLIPWVHRENGVHRVVCWLGFTYMAMISVLTWTLCYADIGDQVKAIHKEKHFPDTLETPPGWKNCPTCQVDSPPRSYHCRVCNKCVLKRDHHCFFCGNCIGYFNQRYYFVFLTYMIVANVWTVAEMILYLTENLPIYQNATSYVPFLAFFQWLLGYVSFMSAFVVTHVYFCIMCAGAAFFFLFWQMMFISAGYTTYEAHKGIRLYQRSFLDNVRSTFGPLHLAWFLFIFPWPFDMCGNGVQFKGKRSQ